MFSRIVFVAVFGVLACSLAGAQDLGVIHYWAFDGNTLDLVGGQHGTAVGGPTFVAGWVGEGLLFNGASDAIVAAVDINPATLPAITMGAWVRAYDATPVHQVISHDNSLYDRSLCIDNRGAGGTGWSAFTGIGVMGGSVAVTTGQYQMVAVTYDQVTNQAMLYVDGVTETATTALGSGFDFLNIGRNPFQGGIEHFEGVIDEVFICDRALTAQELDQIRLAGHLPGNFPFFRDGFELGNTTAWSLVVP